MERVLLGAVLSVVTSSTIGRWDQERKTDLDLRRDNFDSENVIVTTHGGWQRVEPFTAAMEINE